MATTLRDALIAVPPAETSGPRSHNRFDFQADWALCHLLELHASGSDYVIIFDYHDDVLVLDSATDPATVVFFQIKTKSSGAWTRAELVYRSKNLQSIIAKLYKHFLSFPSHTKGLQFVTNAGFSIRRGTDAKASHCDSFTPADTHNNEQEALAKAISQQLSTALPLAGMTLLRFDRCSLSQNDHTNHALGKLNAFLESLPGTDEVPLKALNAFFRSLKMEILRGSTDESSPTTFDDLCRLKAISRSRFDEMLHKVKSSTPQPNWSDIIRQRLTAEGVAFAATTRLCAHVARFVADRFDPTNALLQEAITAIAPWIQIEELELLRLSEAIEAVFNRVRDFPQVVLLVEGQHADYVRAAIGVLLHEQQTIPNADTIAEDESP